MTQTNHVIVHVIFPLIIGTLIYILFRNDRILIFEWIKYVSIDDTIYTIRRSTLPLCKYIPNFILYSIPDFIWVYSGTISLLYIWKCSMYKYLWIFLPVICAVGAEILQKVGLISGTFCIIDITFYITGFVLSYIIGRRINE